MDLVVSELITLEIDTAKNGSLRSYARVVAVRIGVGAHERSRSLAEHVRGTADARLSRARARSI